MDKQLLILQEELDRLAQRADTEAGIEFWFARDLQTPPRLYALGELPDSRPKGYNIL